ncbi:28S ribosomal protein S5, mitochondrial [Purpureocillium takamizusanense]|uniref:28S ribosomal protein S5, mitochondrial n=1 Tax=Purpureocillium takamizusanense TaxID=2060973 RepID=A0A9Q8QI10_9HYPO|nr:28S ribosomal protein S5, mitochondrial [Purpureocillium takamizusanense]UNI20213.1 28S ribosomal protein S5, mitochondrial [Purpureocillium takamizusanense]
MSVARRAAHGLLGRCLAPSTRSHRPVPAAAGPAAVQRAAQFHSSAARSKRRSRFRNVKAEELGLLNPAKLAEYREEHFPEYSEQDLEALKSKYTPEQLEALQAGEQAVNPDDLVFQGRLRDDPYRPNYVEDFTVLDPRYDLKPQTEVTPREPEWPSRSKWNALHAFRLAKLVATKATDQHQRAHDRALVRALRRIKAGEMGEDHYIDLTMDELNDMEKDPELFQKHLANEEKEAEVVDEADPEFEALWKERKAETKNFDKLFDEELAKENRNIPDPVITNLELLENGPAGASRAHSAEAVELGKVPGVEGLYKSAVDPEDEGQDDSGYYQEIKRLTGLSLKDLQSIYNKVLVTRWVANQTRLGKVRSSSVVAIAGNGNGRLGIGIAKSTEASLAAETAQLLAIRNMKPIRRYENRTIYGNVSAKVSGTVVELFARPPGFGLRCPHRIFEMCRAAGIHDIAARMPRSKNPMNSVKAAYDALVNQPDPEEIAIGRGKKLVDVRKVYYGGSVH